MAMEGKSPETRTKSFKSRWLATAWPRSMGWTMDDARFCTYVYQSAHIYIYVYMYVIILIYIIYQNINLYIYTIYIYIAINKSINKSTYQSTTQPINQPMNLSSTKRTCWNAALASVTIPQDLLKNRASKPFFFWTTFTSFTTFQDRSVW
jgi:hypothetical protein